jgi:hypothetical protein
MALPQWIALMLSTWLLICSTVYHLCLSLWYAPPDFLAPFLPGRHDRKLSQNPPIRISKSANELKPAYDVVVIGSGYGAGVAASRMARAEPKQSVCVLEKGLERWPGGFPMTTFSALWELRVTGRIRLGLFKEVAIRLGKASGLYHWICAGESNAFVANGKNATKVFRSR